ncbi:MAG: porin, partial [Acidiphilium sp.]
VKLNADYLKSSPIGTSGPLSTTTITTTGVSDGFLTGKSTTSVSDLQYKGMGIGMVGAQVTYGGFLLGGNIKDGQVNNGYTFLLPGQRDLLFYELTGEYTAGPYTIGVQYFNNQSAGAHLIGNGTGRTQTNYGFDVGANYAISPNLGVYAMYLYGHRHQAGYDFITNATKSTAFNNVQAQALTAGAQFKW